MTKKNQIYKCNICGNIVEVLHAGEGDIFCCGEPMMLLKEKTDGEGEGKHIPVIEKTALGVKVTVSSMTHVMEKDHYIEWIDILADGRVYRKWLTPGDKPEANFEVKSDKIEAREYCNLHGLWGSKT